MFFIMLGAQSALIEDFWLTTQKEFDTTGLYQVKT